MQESHSGGISALSTVLVPIHRAGWPFIAVFALVTVGLAVLWGPLGLIGLVLTAWCAWFFRDPPRVTPVRPGLIVSPADGTLLPIVAAPPPAELGLGDAPRTRVSIFLNVFDVHIQRAPCDGTVTRAAYRPGAFVNANLDKASTDNERMALAIALPGDRDLACVQIAGLVARRIVCDVGDGAVLQAGQRYGLIRFGSRVDLYLPEGAVPLVAAGQKAVAGETVIADLNSTEPARPGVVR